MLLGDDKALTEKSRKAWRKEPAENHADVPLLDEVRITIEEARVVLPGIQTLFGFQLIAAFNARFDDLSAADRAAHLVALVLVAIAVALVMAPAAYHRISERGQVSRHFVDLASRFIASALVPLMLGISLDVYVVAALITKRASIGIAVGLAVLVVFTGVWFVLPFLHRERHRPVPPRSSKR